MTSTPTPDALELQALALEARDPQRGMDHPARTGLIGAGIALGRTFQPNLLTRGTTDQAVISGVTTAFAYGVYSSADAIVDSLAARISGQDHPGPNSRLIVAGVLAALGAGTFAGFKWREHESRPRAAVRVAGRSIAVAAISSAASTLTGERRSGRRWGLAVAGAATAASWASMTPWRAAPGSLIRQDESDEHHTPGQDRFFEDSVREIAPVKMAAIGAGIAAATYGVARAESLLTHGMARLASASLGGKPEDHRALGRITALGVSAGAAYLALNRVSGMLTKGGEAVEPGMEEPPSSPEITGCAESGLAWMKQTREGARWLTSAIEPATIDSVMGTSKAKQPVRVYASLDIAEDPHERVAILLREIDRTKALQRGHFALFSPTGSGYVNYVATETFEFLTGGDCASAAIQYSVLPSSFSLGNVSTGVDQTRMVIDGITERLLAMDPSERPRFYLFGESLGSQVSEGMFEGTWTYGPPGAKVDYALWIGTPSATKWRKQLWGDRSITEVPDVGPDGIYLPRTIRDWLNLSDDERTQVRYLLLQNGDDPIPKFGSQLLWRRPDWLGPERPVGAPQHTHWVPGATFLMTFIDMLNALTPVPGVFAQGGHDYREILPSALSQTWRLPASDEQMDAMDRVMRERELAWELYRAWSAALAEEPGKQAAARAKVLAKASQYVESDVDEARLIELVDRALPRRAAALRAMA